MGKRMYSILPQKIILNLIQLITSLGYSREHGIIQRYLHCAYLGVLVT